MDTLIQTPDFKAISVDPTQTLQRFDLDDLAQYTAEKSFDPEVSKDFRLFFVGHDDVHNILKHVFARLSSSLYLNMFGFDDEELNDIIWEKVMNPNITVMITLDKSQAGGVHERKLLDADREKNLAAFNSHFVIGTSATSQISHTKGFVADGKVGGEGSTNWSDSGEGTGIFEVGKKGFKAQNNTQTIFTDRININRFTNQLIAEHLAAVKHKQNN